MDKRSKTYLKRSYGGFTLQMLVIIGIVIVANLLTQELYFRVDFTEDKRYTLSRATRDILRENTDSYITIRLHFSEGLPPTLSHLRQEIKDLLIEYGARSQGRVVYEFVNPNKNEESEQEAQRIGIQPVLLNVRERDQVKQMRAYLGAIVYVGEQQEVIPILTTQTSLEFAFTQAIKKLVTTEKMPVALIQGHEEPLWSDMVSLQRQLEVLYDLEEVSLSDEATELQAYKALLWIRPMDSVPRESVEKLEQYLSQGGKLLMAYSQVKADLDGSYPRLLPSTNEYIKGFINSMGLDWREACVVDAKAGSVNVQQQQAGFVFNVPMRFHYFPIVENFAEHPITQGMEQLYLWYPGDIQVLPTDSLQKHTPLMFTSDLGGSVPLPHPINMSKTWQKTDFSIPNKALAYTIEGRLFGSEEAKVVYIPSDDFIAPLNPQQKATENGVNFVANAVDWLLDDTGLIDLRTKGIVSRPLHTLEDTEKTLLKYVNMLAPILLVVLYGIIRYQGSVRTRYKRMYKG